MRRLFATAAALLAATAPALAHLAPEAHGSFLAGVSHPLFGLDHVLAMVAVGLWAAAVGGRALPCVPAAFVATMTAGFVLALSGMPLPFVEPAILASVVVLGLLVAFAVRLPVAASAAIVGAFALFHGHAHGGEIGAASALAYGAGFAVATVLLHAAGAGIGLGLARRKGQMLPRALGAGTALAGLALMVG